jgi:hypothetical protein
MKVKNYQEDLVLRTINLVLEDRTDVPSSDSLIRDVAAYTLNRMPPKYIMSERGFTRLASEFWTNGSNGGGNSEHLLDLVEMVLLVHRGIDVVKNRRKDEGVERPVDTQGKAIAEEEPIGFWHNFPHFIGKVVDKTTKKPVYGVRATLFINGEKAPPAEAGWSNPYFSNKGSKGFYSFWPEPRRYREEQKNFLITVTLEHKDYRTATQEMNLFTHGDFQWNDFIDTESIYSLGTCVLDKA